MVQNLLRAIPLALGAAALAFGAASAATESKRGLLSPCSWLPLVVPSTGRPLPRGVIVDPPHTTPTERTLARGLRRPLVVPRAQALVNAQAAGPEFFPSDLQNLGGKVVTSAVQHAIFVNCAESCWGKPTLFLQRLGQSKMIHLVDQYVGQQGDGRYTVGSSLPVRRASSARWA